MCCLPELNTAAMRTVVENAVRAVVSRHRFEKIVGPVSTDRFAGLLAIIARFGKISIQYSRSYLVSFDGLHRGAPTKTSRRRWCAAQTIASAATSGWKIGGTG